MNKTILAGASPLARPLAAPLAAPFAATLAASFALLLAAPTAAQAQRYVLEPPPVTFLAGMGISGGGDQLLNTRYGNDDTASLRAGGTVYLTAGVNYRLIRAFSLQGTINYHVDSAHVRHGDVTFERFPIELIGYYQPGPTFRLGGGVRYTTGTKLSGTGAASDLNVRFDDATSAVVEAEYFPYLDVGIKLRYVNETFKAPGYGKVDGSHVGLSVNVYF